MSLSVTLNLLHSENIGVIDWVYQMIVMQISNIDKNPHIYRQPALVSDI